MEGKPSEQAEANEIQPNDDAVDYMDIQEMAEDIAPKPLALAPTFFKPVPLLPVSESVAVAAPKIQGRLKFSEIFASHVASVPQVFRTKALPGTFMIVPLLITFHSRQGRWLGCSPK